eukprot:GHVS01086187.1.p1 GENE.GHVS01086187.1~~GHVS01086187.1.p1  ORF type:complete len:563 (-),score=107.91 GHVS01086187.1:674-2362(-)
MGSAVWHRMARMSGFRICSVRTDNPPPFTPFRTAVLAGGGAPSTTMLQNRKQRPMYLCSDFLMHEESTPNDPKDTCWVEEVPFFSKPRQNKVTIKHKQLHPPPTTTNLQSTTTLYGRGRTSTTPPPHQRLYSPAMNQRLVEVVGCYAESTYASRQRAAAVEEGQRLTTTTTTQPRPKEEEEECCCVAGRDVFRSVANTLEGLPAAFVRQFENYGLRIQEETWEKQNRWDEEEEPDRRKQVVSFREKGKEAAAVPRMVPRSFGPANAKPSTISSGLLIDLYEWICAVMEILQQKIHQRGVRTATTPRRRAISTLICNDGGGSRRGRSAAGRTTAVLRWGEQRRDEEEQRQRNPSWYDRKQRGNNNSIRRSVRTGERISTPRGRRYPSTTTTTTSKPAWRGGGEVERRADEEDEEDEETWRRRRWRRRSGAQQQQTWRYNKQQMNRGKAEEVSSLYSTHNICLPINACVHCFDIHQYSTVLTPVLIVVYVHVMGIVFIYVNIFLYVHSHVQIFNKQTVHVTQQISTTVCVGFGGDRRTAETSRKTCATNSRYSFEVLNGRYLAI